MVKVYYSYSFDKAVGFVTSPNCNFSIDQTRKNPLTKEKSSSPAAVNIFFYYHQRQENWSWSFIGPRRITPFAISKRLRLKCMQRMMGEKLLCGHLKPIKLLVSWININLLFYLFPSVKTRLGLCLVDKMALLSFGTFFQRSIESCISFYIKKISTWKCHYSSRTDHYHV